MPSLDEVNLPLEKYSDLKGDSTRIRAVNAASQKDAGQQYVTQHTLNKFGEKLMENFDHK